MYYKRSADFRLNLSPLSARAIIVSKNFTNVLSEGAQYFGVDKDRGIKYFFRGFNIWVLQKTDNENVIWENNYSVYVNYLEKTKNVDFDWNSNIRFKVNNQISQKFCTSFTL